jgi:hypothetical protein
MLAAGVALLVPLSATPVFAQAEGGTSSGYLGSMYRMDHTPAEGSETTLSLNEPSQPPAASTPELAMRKVPIDHQSTNQLNDLSLEAAEQNQSLAS